MTYTYVRYVAHSVEIIGNSAVMSPLFSSFPFYDTYSFSVLFLLLLLVNSRVLDQESSWVVCACRESGSREWRRFRQLFGFRADSWKRGKTFSHLTFTFQFVFFCRRTVSKSSKNVSNRSLVTEISGNRWQKTQWTGGKQLKRSW